MHRLEFEGARLHVRLGCGVEERASPQDVDLAVRVDLPGDPPNACLSDRLEDTVCYAAMIEAARKVCCGREFHLVEHLAYTIGQSLVESLPRGAGLWLRVTKLAPPVPELSGGVSFAMRFPPRATA